MRCAGRDSAGIARALADTAYPESVDPARVNGFMVVLLVWVMSLYLAMAFAPLATIAP